MSESSDPIEALVRHLEAEGHTRLAGYSDCRGCCALAVLFPLCGPPNCDAARGVLPYLARLRAAKEAAVDLYRELRGCGVDLAAEGEALPDLARRFEDALASCAEIEWQCAARAWTFTSPPAEIGSGSLLIGGSTGPTSIGAVPYHAPGPAAQDAPLGARTLLDLAALCLKFARVERMTRHEDGRRPETDSDHTVMLAVLACACAARSAPRLDLGKIAQFSVVHDLVEAHSGDVPSLAMSAATREAKEKAERASLERIRAETAALPWVAATIAEYESLASEEARFVKIIDKVLPKLTHLLNGGAALRDCGFDAAQTHASHLKQRQTLAAEYPQKEALALYDLVIAECAEVWGFAPKEHAP